MMPVNNNDLEKDAGIHWSLLYSKTNNKFYHYDSIKGVNEKHTNKVIQIISKANPCFKNELVSIKCPQQNDGHSCGIHTIKNACKIAGNIANKGRKNLYNEMET